MGLFNLIATIFGSAPAPKKLEQTPAPPVHRTGVSVSSPKQELTLAHVDHSITVSVSMRASITTPALPEVSDAEVAERAKEYSFVAGNELPPLETADQWWSEKSNKRRLNDNSPKAYTWLAPFVSRERMEQLQLPNVLEQGPGGVDGALKGIRTAIRARRKEKAPFDDLLKELYGAAVLAHFFKSLRTCWTGHWRMPEYVSINDFNDVHIEYPVMGYQCIESLGKTDVK